MTHLSCVYMKPLIYILVKIILRAWGKKTVNVHLQDCPKARQLPRVGVLLAMKQFQPRLIRKLGGLYLRAVFIKPSSLYHVSISSNY